MGNYEDGEDQEEFSEENNTRCRSIELEIRRELESEYPEILYTEKKLKSLNVTHEFIETLRECADGRTLFINFFHPHGMLGDEARGYKINALYGSFSDIRYLGWPETNHYLDDDKKYIAVESTKIPNDAEADLNPYEMYEIEMQSSLQG